MFSVSSDSFHSAPSPELYLIKFGKQLSNSGLDYRFSNGDKMWSVVAKDQQKEPHTRESLMDSMNGP